MNKKVMLSSMNLLFVFSIFSVSITDLNNDPDTANRPVVVNGILDLSNKNIDDLSGISDIIDIETMTIIYLEGNSFTSPSLDFTGCNNLIHLYMENCTQLSSFPIISPDSVREQIEALSLQGCTSVQSVPTFKGQNDYRFTNLKYLNLNDIGLTKFPDSEFNKLKDTLISLNIDNNPNMKGDFPKDLNKYISLTELNMANTGLKKFPKGDLKNIRSQIVHLGLQNNQSMGLPEYEEESDACFDGFTSLISLNIGDIGITDFNLLKNHLDPIKSQLEELYINYSEFNFGSSLDLNGYTGLKLIALDHTGLTAFPTFDGTNNLPNIKSQLERIDIGGGNFDVTTVSLEGWNNIKDFRCRDTPMLSFPYNIFESVKTQLEFIDLRDNSIDANSVDVSDYTSLKTLLL